MKSSNEKVLSQIVGRALSGEGAHAATQEVFDGLDWKAAAMRTPGVPHSIFQLLAHTSYWQDWVLQWLDGKDPVVPKHASGSWPSNPGPASSEEWKRAVRNFRGGLGKLEGRSREVDLLGKIGKTSRLRMFHAIASHTSYHVGQVVMLRQLLGKWPPSSGGLTW
jgi:hypothetical protein